MGKDLIRMPFRDGLTLGVEMNNILGTKASTRPTHLFVHRNDGQYLGFACFACCGDNGKWRAETDECEACYHDNLDAAVTWLDNKGSK